MRKQCASVIMSIGLCLPLWAFNSDDSDEMARDDVQNVLVSPVDNRSPCKFINSTTLRRLIIEEQVKIGMKAEDVQKALGKPKYISDHSSGRTQWTYLYDQQETYYYFVDGCLDSWN
jgi:hypothetical protein